MKSERRWIEGQKTKSQSESHGTKIKTWTPASSLVDLKMIWKTRAYAARKGKAKYGWTSKEIELTIDKDGQSPAANKTRREHWHRREASFGGSRQKYGWLRGATNWKRSDTDQVPQLKATNGKRMISWTTDRGCLWRCISALITVWSRLRVIWVFHRPRSCIA